MDEQTKHTTKPYPLLKGERLVSIINHPAREYSNRPSTIEQLLRLTRANTIDDIGHTGPALAALALGNTAAPKHLKIYEALFGRDSLRVAIDLVDTHPELARSTLITLAELQGVMFNDAREEEPGRIVHEARETHDSIAHSLTRRFGWDWPYYGSVDATPEFVRTLAAYIRADLNHRDFLKHTYKDKTGQTRTIQDALEKALDWIAMRRRRNTEGLLEYRALLPRGIENQVWKDSWDAYHHSNGALANHAQGIASIEVQVATYDALIDAAEIFEDILDNTARGEVLRNDAGTLKDRIFKLFWTEDKGGYFVLGTDRDDNGTIRQLKLRTSNMGHILNSRLLEGNAPTITHKRTAIIRHILSPQLLCDAGIRTLAADEVKFRPGAYHNGSVWLWDTHYIARGLRRLGYEQEADDLDARILQAVATTKLFPEYVRGEQSHIAVNQQTITLWDDSYKRENIVEQPPQEVQAWTVAAIRAIEARLAKRPT